MYEYRPGMAVVSSPYGYDDPQLVRQRNDKPAGEEKEGICPMPRCRPAKSSAWKFWAVALSLIIILCFIGIALWVAWARSNSGFAEADEGPQGPELPPAICYKCNNYAHIMDGRELSSNIDVEHSEGGAAKVEGALGVAVDVDNPQQELCQEFVNRTALAETQSPADDDCGDSLYNGCFKMITKSYRLTSNVGREQLSVTIVTRNCVEIPRSIPLGCYKTFGGAGMERETCYCKGNYCNVGTTIGASTLLGMILLLHFPNTFV
ncbi:hypothetical protein ECG_04149 [Echinococcus granulosus]|uniref:DUF5746 domain-containing protein n=1 Tax=Echinococcus granulosus TaxID=6210 RepID=U6J0P5_ECHGR|nr:hypothetical protein EGR_02911 [Echinococcus granulosus]EUB62159.1 hypothetical protein EGR_02911 [Echinococcus granulosus]KAH9283782.1 hypothetical protein ECG_04149 [Echinococcus granulosus]CDS17573.1 hypothetical protein EgrG_001033100 [Echinococcus granulosus]